MKIKAENGVYWKEREGKTDSNGVKAEMGNMKEEEKVSQSFRRSCAKVLSKP